ncbi:MAG: 7-cyano-7-deazaguanine synthase QueC [Methanomicrobiales archaeon]|nr:7-cyano-7-deazaguanine synthase QueC [Methanomicrobiales archaeon]
MPRLPPHGSGNAVAIVSGGLDSTTLLYDLVRRGYEVHAVTFDYGQKHRREIACAERTCRRLHVPHRVLDLPLLNELAPSALTRAERAVPSGHYAEDVMRQTVVPNRNMVFLSLAGAYAIGIGARRLFYGAHAGDHPIYPDCRPVFVTAMQTAFHLADWSDLILEAPYLYLTKGDIVRIGLELGVDYADTWTCYRGEELACGRCGACVERLEAFRDAGARDPLPYGAD